MKILFMVLLVASFAITGTRIMSADPVEQNPPHPVTPVMKMKLAKSKAILEGLAIEDFDAVAKNARELKSLSLESGWNVLQTMEYASQSRDFRRAADLIAEAASEKDINRATLGYVSMTVRCIECHSYMRKHRIELN